MLLDVYFIKSDLFASHSHSIRALRQRYVWMAAALRANSKLRNCCPKTKGCCHCGFFFFACLIGWALSSNWLGLRSGRGFFRFVKWKSQMKTKKHPPRFGRKLVRAVGGLDVHIYFSALRMDSLRWHAFRKKS